MRSARQALADVAALCDDAARQFGVLLDWREVRVILADVEPEPAPAGDLLEELLKVHRPHRVYTECEHPSGLADVYSTSEAHDGKTPVLVDEIGWTCENGLMYVICQECCMNGGEYQTEECEDNHTHTLDPKDRCLTALIIARHSA